MRVTPVSKEIADAGGGSEPFKPGDYDFIIAEAVDTFSKAGNDMLKLTLHVFNRDGEKRTVFDYILSSEVGAWKARHLMESISMVRQYELGNIDPHEIQGRPGRCKLRVEPAGQFPAKNSVTDYIEKERDDPMPAPVSRSLRPAEARKPVPAGAGGGDLDDEIPFGACWQ